MSKRWLLILALLVVAGAIVNVAVACSIAALVDIDRGTERLTFIDAMSEQGGYILIAERTRRGYTQSIRRLIRRHSFGVDTRGSYMIEFPRTPQDFDIVRMKPGETIERAHPGLHEELTSGRGSVPAGTVAYWPWENRAGWPMRSMRCRLENLLGVPSSRSMARTGAVTIHSGIWLESTNQPPSRRALPLEPIWFGFLVNTMFYAVLIAAMGIGVLRFRHWNRLRRGLCPGCTYPIGISPICTECGVDLPAKKRLPT